MISKNASVVNSNNIRFATESDYNINRFSKLLKNLNIDHNIEFDGKSFVITIKKKNLEELKDSIKIENKNIEVIEKNENKITIRGAFLGAGSINNPENNYHLEINLSNNINLIYIEKMLKTLDINCKKLEQENKYSIYLKDAEEISKLLALLGANKSVLKFEDIRVQKEMRGKVNRIVNCQTANLNKTLNASVEQIEAIRKLKSKNKFNLLDENLKEIAPYVELETHTTRMTEQNVVELLKEADVICEAFDDAQAKAMLTNSVLENFPQKYFVAASGMAGIGSANSIRTRQITKRFYLCGDGVSDVGDDIGLVSSRVMLCAAHEAHMVLRILAEEFEV